MFLHIVKADYVADYIINFTFNNGIVKEVDLKNELSGEIFEPLKDIEFFKKFEISAEIKTICWPNGADFAPEHLFEIGQYLRKTA